MSDDTTNDVDPTRADWSFPIAVDLDDDPRRLDNPLVKGMIVLIMVAIAGTVLVATDDDDEGIVAAGAIESEPLAPAAVESPVTSVQAVASDTASSDGDADADSWTAPAAAASQTISAERLRQERVEGRTTTTAPTTTSTTEVPSTTAAPTTAAPTTAAAAEETSTTDGEATTTTVAGQDGDSTTSTDATAPESTTTSTPASTETTVAETTTTAPPETTTTAAGDGWVDTGNGVLVPPVLLAIRWCESRDDYQAANPSSSARGAYQFLSGSWAAYGHADRYGVSTADQAGRAQQDEAALLTWERDGTRPWNASRSCWSQRI